VKMFILKDFMCHGLIKLSEKTIEYQGVRKKTEIDSSE